MNRASGQSPRLPGSYRLIKCEGDADAHEPEEREGAVCLAKGAAFEMEQPAESLASQDGGKHGETQGTEKLAAAS